MKRIVILFQLFVFSNAYSQENEFAATAFYKEFTKIYGDGQTGFIVCKGNQRKTGYEALQSEFRSRCNLPLADSGKIVVPLSSNPYAIFYFEPSKMRLKVDQLGVNLRDAVVTAFGKPLYARTETYILNNYPFTNTLFFTEPGEEREKAATFRQCIYHSDGKYFLSFEIRGRK